MPELEVTDSATPAPSRPPSSGPRPAGSGLGGVAAVLAVAALTLAGYSAWRVVEFERNVGVRADALREAQADLQRKTTQLELATERLRADVENNLRRFGDVEAVNKSLREEILGLGERAKLLEDAM